MDVRQYGLGASLGTLMAYYEQYWLGVVGSDRFTVYRLRHRTNNFIESYHANILRRMGQHPALYVFYDHLRGIEQQSRIDFQRALDGLQVRRTATHMYARNMGVLSDAWQQRVEIGHYTLLEFQHYTAHTPEQILVNEIGELNFNEDHAQDIVLDLQPLAVPPLPVHHIPTIPQARGRGNARIRGRAGIRGRARGVVPDDVAPNRGRGRMVHAWNDFLAEIEDLDDNDELIANIEHAPIIQPPVVSVVPDAPEIVELCIICFDNEASITMVPCRHQFCNTCALRLMEEQVVRCPLCRAISTHYDGL